MDKSLIIVVDSFSERVFEYDNVHLYDFGFRNEVTFYDYVANGLGAIDETQVTLRDTTGGFYRVTPDNFEYSFGRDIDFERQSVVQVNGQEAVASTYSDFLRVWPIRQDVPAHGDWVIEALSQRLIDPTKTDILAIDINIFAGQYQLPFLDRSFTFDGAAYTQPAMLGVLYDFLETFDAAYNPASNTSFLPTAVSVSLGSTVVAEPELRTLDSLERLQIPVFQASANEGQRGTNWGRFEPSVINVGAWNRASNGELLIASEQSEGTIDIIGDGLVFRSDWGGGFGTSFATPKVVAEFANLTNGLIADLNAQGQRLVDFADTTGVPPSFSHLVATAIPALTTDVSVTYSGAGSSAVRLPISNGTLADIGLAPRFVPGVLDGLFGTTLASLNLIPDSTTPTGGRDFLTGGAASDVLSGFDGDDTLSGLGGDDVIDGGAGIDIAVFSGAQAAYTLILGSGQIRLQDRRPDVNGTDTLIDVEFLDFTVDTLGVPFDLTKFGAVAGLSGPEFESFIELYIAYFNRAPDAVGLNFWGSAFASDTTLDEMASLFIDQVETRATYPAGTTNMEFATEVYNNVLGRTPDPDGFAFWVNLLNSGGVTRDTFILRVLEGAKSELKTDLGADFVASQVADRAFLEDKIDVGAYFAVHRGMSDVDHATSVMAMFDGSQESRSAAFAEIDAQYQQALDPRSGAFLIQVVGVLDDPFLA